MKRLAILSMGVFAGVLAAGACGGLPDSDSLFGNGAGGSLQTSVTTTSTTGFAGVTATSSSSATTSASSSGSSASSSSASSTGSAASTTSSVSSSASSSSGNPPPPPVACAGGTCNAGQVCCYNPTGQGDHCGDQGQCDQGFAELDCSDPTACPNGVCCAQYNVVNNSAIYTGISCQPTCGTQGSQFVLCSAAEPGCPPGTQCVQSELLGQGYMICAN